MNKPQKTNYEAPRSPPWADAVSSLQGRLFIFAAFHPRSKLRGIQAARQIKKIIYITEQ